jgi:glycosyltransferase involved in cell wall biosynthesis
VTEPAATIAVSSRNRPLRLRWLLNALLEQTAEPGSFEVVVAHDSSSAQTEQLLDTHSLHAAGHLRQLRFAPESMLAAPKRNAAWRAARAPLILFTDDDCRPAPDWVERALAAARGQPGAIVQGRTVPDPDEQATYLGAPWAHTQRVEPVSAEAETCNILYPRELLERLGGFEEDLGVGEDSDLALRAKEQGVHIVPAPEMLVYHAVDECFLPGRLRSLGRWQDMPLLVKRRPEARRDMWGRIWWKPEHAALVCAVVGGRVSRRPAARVALALPWMMLSMRHRGRTPRGLVRAVTELPGHAAVDATEMLVLARGSIRHRALLL